MDKVSLKQIIERIPELCYKYVGSFPCDKIPNLPNYSFAIINNQPSGFAGEHWIMVARTMDKFYYADSLGEKYKFLDKKYRPMISSKLQKIENLCGFYTIYAAYELFKFNITHINYFNDVLVLNFISNYM